MFAPLSNSTKNTAATALNTTKTNDVAPRFHKKSNYVSRQQKVQKARLDGMYIQAKGMEAVTAAEAPF